MTEIGEGIDQTPDLKLRKEQASPIETIIVPEQQGDERSIRLNIAQLQMEKDLDVVSLLLLHTHTPGGPIQLSQDDIDNWKEEQKRPPASIENPQDGSFMRVTNVRPVVMMLTPNSENIDQSSIVALAQTEEAKLEGGAVELAFDLVAGASLDEEENLASLKESLAKVGFGMDHFKLSQKEEIQRFIFEYLPEKLILEEAGIPKFQESHSGPDLSFLER